MVSLLLVRPSTTISLKWVTLRSSNCCTTGTWNGSGPFLRHSIIFYNQFRFTTEYKTFVPMVTFIQTDASEHIRPGRQPSAFFHLFIINRLLFPLRMFFNKLRVHMFGMVLELRVEPQRPANAHQRHPLPSASIEADHKKRDRRRQIPRIPDPIFFHLLVHDQQMPILIILSFAGPLHDCMRLVHHCPVPVTSRHACILADFPGAVGDAGQYLYELDLGKCYFFSCNQVY